MEVYVVIGMCEVFIMNNHMRIKMVSIARIQGFVKHMIYVILYIKATMVVSVCLSVWAMPGRFFQSLFVPCGVSPDVTSPDVTDSREKKK